MVGVLGSGLMVGLGLVMVSRLPTLSQATYRMRPASLMTRHRFGPGAFPEGSPHPPPFFTLSLFRRAGSSALGEDWPVRPATRETTPATLGAARPSPPSHWS